MNRKQEVVLWIAGVAVALVCMARADGSQWVLGVVTPIAVLGWLLFVSLRSRQPSAPIPGSRAALLLIVVGVLLVAIQDAERAARDAFEEVQRITEPSSRYRSLRR